MKYNQKTINYMLLVATIFSITACGGGNSGDSSSCLTADYTDSDGDGFPDAIDFAPNDASIPGDFSTPEKILANPEVKKVLKIAKEQGVEVRTDLGNSPPNLTGYYRMESGGGGSIVLPLDIYRDGVPYNGNESRICTAKGHYESFGSNFHPSRGATNSYTRMYTILRGGKNHYTSYSFFSRLLENKKFYYRIEIGSANINSEGDIVNERNMDVLVYKSDSSISAYKSGLAYYDTRNKITNLDELEYMCVDGDKAYIPTETWINKDKETCTCSMDIEIECS